MQTDHTYYYEQTRADIYYSIIRFNYMFSTEEKLFDLYIKPLKSMFTFFFLYDESKFFHLWFNMH